MKTIYCRVLYDKYSVEIELSEGAFVVIMLTKPSNPYTFNNNFTTFSNYYNHMCQDGSTRPNARAHVSTCPSYYCLAIVTAQQKAPKAFDYTAGIII